MCSFEEVRFMKERLKKILERDNYICGLHSGGCKKIIDLVSDQPTLDHIIPKSYIQKRTNKKDFRKSWNYQPMCQKCNQKREGQIIDWPNFNCKCHGIYIDDFGVRWVMYKHRTKWHRVKYFEEMKIPDKAPDEHKIISDVMMISGGRKNYGGAKALGIGKFGHLFYPVKFYKRLESNVFEFERTEQWEELEKEIEKFAKHYLKDGGKNLKNEVKENYKYYMANWIYWDFKAQQQNQREKKKGKIEIIKQIMKKYSLTDDREYLEIEKIVEQLIASKRSFLRKNRSFKNPIGSLIFSKNKSQRVVNKFLTGNFFCRIFSKNENQKAINEAWENWRKGDKEKTEYLLNKYIKEYPQDTIGWRNRATFRAIMNDFNGACEDLTKAIKLKKNADFYASRSDIKMRMGDIKGAKEDIEQALSIYEKEKNESGYKDKYFADAITGHHKKKIQEEAKEWRKIQEKIIEKEKSSDYEFLCLWRETRSYLAQGKWEETIKGCERFFKIYKKDGSKKFLKKMGKYKDESRAEFYWMKIMSKISLEEGLLGACRLGKSIFDEGGSAIEQEMEKEIYTIDLNDFILLTDKVKERTKRAIEQLIKEGKITMTKRTLTKEERAKLPKKRLKLIRPAHGRD